MEPHTGGLPHRHFIRGHKWLDLAAWGPDGRGRRKRYLHNHRERRLPHLRRARGWRIGRRDDFIRVQWCHHRPHHRCDIRCGRNPVLSLPEPSHRGLLLHTLRGGEECDHQRPVRDVGVPRNRLPVVGLEPRRDDTRLPLLLLAERDLLLHRVSCGEGIDHREPAGCLSLRGRQLQLPARFRYGRASLAIL